MDLRRAQSGRCHEGHDIMTVSTLLNGLTARSRNGEGSEILGVAASALLPMLIERTNLNDVQHEQD